MAMLRPRCRGHRRSFTGHEGGARYPIRIAVADAAPRQFGSGNAAAGCGDCVVTPYAGRGRAAAGDTIESGYNTILTLPGGCSLIHLRHCARPAALAAAGMLLAACGDVAPSPTVDAPRPRLSATASHGSLSLSPSTPHPGNTAWVRQRPDAVIALYCPTPAGAAPRPGIQ